MESILRLAYISGILISAYMGESWKNRHVWAGMFGAARGKTFGKFGSINYLMHEKHLFRVLAVAEMFYNLQGKPGVRERARGWLNEDIESVLGELQGVQLLHASGRDVEFNSPNNVKGENYDVRTFIEGGVSVACEIKTKFENTGFSQATVRRTLEQACRQLPSDGLTAIIMKAPEQWFDQIDARETLEAATKDIFRQRSNISAIFFHWELWKQEGTSTVQNFTVAKHINDDARQKHPELEDLIQAPLTHYKRLHEIVNIPHISFQSSEVETA